MEIDGRKVTDDNDFRLRVAERNPGDKIKLKVNRNGEIKNITVTLTDRPDDRPPQQLSEKETEKLEIKVANLTTERARRYGFEDEEGVIVTEVKQSSSAYRKGVREGDLITSINRAIVMSVQDYDRIIDELKPGDVVLLRLKKRLRDGISNFYVTIRIPK